MSNEQCPAPNEVNVPITGITVPFCGFGVNIDASKLPKCECGLTRDEVQAMIDAAMGKAVDEAVKQASRYNLCEFYFFRNPALRPGFRPAQGDLLENAAALYPEAWAYLQTEEGQALCVTEEEWQAMTHATWATLADETKVGWNGIGGAPFFALHTDTGALRLPDIRGMYAEAAGFDELGVGGVHLDAMQGHFHENYATCNGGPEYYFDSVNPGGWYAYTNRKTGRPISDGINGTPRTASKTQPRAWGALPCVYLGKPAE